MCTPYISRGCDKMLGRVTEAREDLGSRFQTTLSSVAWLHLFRQNIPGGGMLSIHWQTKKERNEREEGLKKR